MKFVMLHFDFDTPILMTPFPGRDPAALLPAGAILDRTNFVFLRRLMLRVARPREARRSILAGSHADDDCDSLMRITSTQR